MTSLVPNPSSLEQNILEKIHLAVKTDAFKPVQVTTHSAYQGMLCSLWTLPCAHQDAAPCTLGPYCPASTECTCTLVTALSI